MDRIYVSVYVCVTRLPSARHSARRPHRPPGGNAAPELTTREDPRPPAPRRAAVGAAANAVPQGAARRRRRSEKPLCPRPAATAGGVDAAFTGSQIGLHLARRPCSGRDIPEHMTQDCAQTVLPPFGKTPQLLGTFCSSARSPAQ